jgi:hypothetical protein
MVSDIFFFCWRRGSKDFADSFNFAGWEVDNWGSDCSVCACPGGLEQAGLALAAVGASGLKLSPLT